MTTTAAMAGIAERLEAGGLVVAAASASVTSRILAPVLEVRVQAGDRVRAGQVLVVLDDRDLAAHARQAEAAVSAAEQGLSAAQADQEGAAADQKLAAAWHARVATLHGRNSATAQELDEAVARLAGATARIESVRARIAQASSNVAAARAASEAATTTTSFAVIRAPFDGLVTETLVDPGNLASPGTPLLRLDSSGPLRVEARVDEARMAHVRAGDRVEVLVDSMAVDGTVTEIARAVDADRRTFTVKASLPPGLAARTGTFARVRFRGATRQALVVPADSVRRQGQVATVFVVQDDVARLRLLQTGNEDVEGVEILAGLEAGEVVVRTPPAALMDGQRVTPGPAEARTGARR
jgi:multidrug resistance efflux pump